MLMIMSQPVPLLHYLMLMLMVLMLASQVRIGLKKARRRVPMVSFINRYPNHIIWPFLLLRVIKHWLAQAASKLTLEYKRTRRRREREIERRDE